MKTNRFSYISQYLCLMSRQTMLNVTSQWHIVLMIVLCLSYAGKFVDAEQINLAETAELDEVLDYEIFPYNEYEKLEKLQEQGHCKAWANRVVSHLKQMIFQLEHSPAKAREELILLRGLLDTPPESEVVSLFEGDDRFNSHCLAAVLKHRTVIWEHVIALLEREQTETPYGVVPRMRFDDVARLYEKSDAVRHSLLLSRNGQDWIQFLQLTPLHSRLGQVMIAKNQLAAEPVEKYAHNYTIPLSTNSEKSADASWSTDTERLSDEECRMISILVNDAFTQQQRTSLTPEQMQLLESPMIRDWVTEMERWRSNALHPVELLAAYESYRQYRGLSDSSRLSVLTRQMIGSKSPELQVFGQAVQNEFSHAHLKLFISKYLINTLLPKMEPEYDRVRENMVGQQVVGHRRADTQLFVTLVPDPNRLLLTLNVNGQVTAQTTASTFPATLHSQSHGVYSATKQLELTSRGVMAQPADVSANSRVKLSNVETDLDLVPIVSDLIRGIAKEQYGSQQHQIQAEARAKVLTQAKQRIDTEADTRFRELNAQIERHFFSVLRNRQAALEPYEAKTTDEWLLTSWYVATPYSLGSDSKEPVTPQGAIGDLKIHELGINAMLERFELAGKQMTLRELKRYLVTMIGQPELQIPKEENDEVVVGFADMNPVGIRFMQNRVELLLNLKRLQVENREWHDFCVVVCYVPGVLPDGTPRLVRQGAVQLDGRLSLMQQVALRTIFSKIFLQLDELPLKPRLFDNDERFTELTTGFVRIENGWFAVALLPRRVPDKQAPVVVPTVRVKSPQMAQRPAAGQNQTQRR